MFPSSSVDGEDSRTPSSLWSDPYTCMSQDKVRVTLRRWTAIIGTKMFTFLFTQRDGEGVVFQTVSRQ